MERIPAYYYDVWVGRTVCHHQRASPVPCEVLTGDRSTRGICSTPSTIAGGRPRTTCFPTRRRASSAMTLFNPSKCTPPGTDWPCSTQRPFCRRIMSDFDVGIWSEGNVLRASVG
jgi:hypothetical protein